MSKCLKRLSRSWRSFSGSGWFSHSSLTYALLGAKTSSMSVPATKSTMGMSEPKAKAWTLICSNISNNWWTWQCSSSRCKTLARQQRCSSWWTMVVNNQAWANQPTIKDNSSTSSNSLATCPSNNSLATCPSNSQVRCMQTESKWECQWASLLALLLCKIKTNTISLEVFAQKFNFFQTKSINSTV